MCCFLTTYFSVIRKRLFLFFFCMLKWLQVTYMIHFNGEFSKKIKIIYLEALVIWKLIFNLFLLIDTLDPHWPVAFQNSSDPTHRILHCFSSSFFFFSSYIWKLSFLAVEERFIFMLLYMHPSSLHIFWKINSFQFGLYLIYLIYKSAETVFFIGVWVKQILSLKTKGNTGVFSNTVLY